MLQVALDPDGRGFGMLVNPRLLTHSPALLARLS
jgi:hypothetical protein